MKIKNLKIITLKLILVFIFIGCEKEYDNIIENSIYDYSVKSVSPTDSIKYLVTDSLITIKISFGLIPNLQSVFCDVFDVDNIKLNSSPVVLFDNGDLANGDSTSNDGSFSNRFPLSTYYPNGNYNIKYFVIDKSEQTKQVAIATFIYNNGQPNKAPFISNAILPDSVNVNVSFIFSVAAQDSNGYRDIKRVYFQLYRPDSTLVVGGNGQSKFDLDDKGNLSVFGDELGGDGIFTYKNSFSSTAQKGFWRFEFEAEDRAGLVSNKITKSIKVL